MCTDKIFSWTYIKKIIRAVNGVLCFFFCGNWVQQYAHFVEIPTLCNNVWRCLGLFCFSINLQYAGMCDAPKFKQKYFFKNIFFDGYSTSLNFTSFETSKKLGKFISLAGGPNRLELYLTADDSVWDISAEHLSHIAEIQSRRKKTRRFLENNQPQGGMMQPNVKLIVFLPFINSSNSEVFLFILYHSNRPIPIVGIVEQHIWLFIFVAFHVVECPQKQVTVLCAVFPSFSSSSCSSSFGCHC